MCLVRGQEDWGESLASSGYVLRLRDFDRKCVQMGLPVRKKEVGCVVKP